MKEGIGIGCAALLFLALAIIAPLGWWGFQVFFAEEIGKGNAEIQIQSAPSRITNYNYFFNQCASIQTLEQQIDAETERLANTEDVAQRNIIMANLSGLSGQRARAVNNYNARATAEYTSGLFQDSELPYTINSSYTAGGPKTQCGV